MRPIDADLLGLTDMEIIMCDGDYKKALKMLIDKIEHAPTIEPEIVRCKDCRHNHDCNIQYHAQAGEEFYCGAAERREE